MLKNLLSKRVAATPNHQQSRPDQAHGGCTMEAMEDRLLMASDYLYTGGVGSTEVLPMESLSLNFTRGSTVGFVIYGK